MQISGILHADDNLNMDSIMFVEQMHTVFCMFFMKRSKKHNK